MVIVRALSMSLRPPHTMPFLPCPDIVLMRLIRRVLRIAHVAIRLADSFSLCTTVLVHAYSYVSPVLLILAKISFESFDFHNPLSMYIYLFHFRGLIRDRVNRSYEPW